MGKDDASCHSLVTPLLRFHAQLRALLRPTDKSTTQGTGKGQGRRGSAVDPCRKCIHPEVEKTLQGLRRLLDTPLPTPERPTCLTGSAPVRETGHGQGRDGPIRRSGTGCGRLPVLRRRNPRLLFLWSGVFLLRLAHRTFLGLLFQPPPRITRFAPPVAPGSPKKFIRSAFPAGKSANAPRCSRGSLPWFLHCKHPTAIPPHAAATCAG